MVTLREDSYSNCTFLAGFIIPIPPRLGESARIFFPSFEHGGHLRSTPCVRGTVGIGVTTAASTGLAIYLH